MNRNKIEQFILSQEHCKHPNRIFVITILFVVLFTILILILNKY
jgi:hypothetical protein